MITARDVELRAGSRLLISGGMLQVDSGDRIGLVGRNGAGKTTLMRALAGHTQPEGGSITGTNDVGYLPQDPTAADPHQSVRQRLLSARNLHTAETQMRRAEEGMASVDDATREESMRKYANAEAKFVAAGGYAAAAQAAAVAAGLGITTSQLDQELGSLSGGQRRRVELARLLFADHPILLLDEPTNHLDADSITWLRGFLAKHSGGLVVISHDVHLLDEVVNKVALVDADRMVLDVYNVGWATYLKTRAQDEQRRKRERAIADSTAQRLTQQAEKMRAKATKARAAQQMLRRADELRSSQPEVRRDEKVASLRFPTPKPCGRVPLTAANLSKTYGSQEVFAAVDLAIDRGSRVVIMGLNGAGKTTLLRVLAGVEKSDTGEVVPGHGLKVGYFAQEHETLDMSATMMQNLQREASDTTTQQIRDLLGSFMFTGDRVNQITGTLSGGERTRLALAGLVISGANVLLLDEPTNNLDPASRDRVLEALNSYPGAVVLVTHDAGAADALNPERVLMLPDATEDIWNDSYRDLIALS